VPHSVRDAVRQAMTPENDHAASAEIQRLVAELEEAQAYEQKLRQLIVEVRDEMAAGRIEQALSRLNTALNDIDSATDVVVPPHRSK
jgi:hypothetical protein